MDKVEGDKGGPEGRRHGMWKSRDLPTPVHTLSTRGVENVAANLGCRCCTKVGWRPQARVEVLIPCPVCQDSALREALCRCLRRGLQARSAGRACCGCWRVGQRLRRREEVSLGHRMGP